MGKGVESQRVPGPGGRAAAGWGRRGGAAALLVCVEGGAERLCVWAEFVAWKRGC